MLSSFYVCVRVQTKCTHAHTQYKCERNVCLHQHAQALVHVRSTDSARQWQINMKSQYRHFIITWNLLFGVGRFRIVYIYIYIPLSFFISSKWRSIYGTTVQRTLNINGTLKTLAKRSFFVVAVNTLPSRDTCSIHEELDKFRNGIIYFI